MRQSESFDADDLDAIEDSLDAETEARREEIVDQTTAARTVEDLHAEIKTLQRLEGCAYDLRRSGEDKKWQELAGLLGEIFASNPTDAGITSEFDGATVNFWLAELLAKARPPS